MLLEPIISALRSRCATFANRVQGAARFVPLPEADTLAVPCAYVIALEDSPSSTKSLNDLRQDLDENFAVIVAVETLTDTTGLSGTASMEALRGELWAALLGWSPSARHEAIIYKGTQLLSLDSQRLWYRFNFGARMEIGPNDGWQITDLVNFDAATIRLNALDPTDPNASSQPDGRVEVVFSVPQTGSLN